MTAVDAVLKGMLVALNIVPEKLKIEAENALQDVRRFFSFDLSLVKTNLLENDLSDAHIESFEYLHKRVYSDEKASNRMFSQLPTVPAVIDWSLINNLQLSTEDLVGALEHPSRIISNNAAFLIKYGAAGSRAIQMAKDNVGEDKWKFFEDNPKQFYPYLTSW